MRKLSMALIPLVFSFAAWAQDPAPPPPIQGGAPISQDQAPPPPPGVMGRGHHFPGTGGKITAINGNSITIEQRDGKIAQVNITDKTKFRKERQDATIADFKVGDEIMVRGESSADGVWQAGMVGTRPAGGFGRGNFREGMGKEFIAGEVKAINGTQLTIQRPDGVTQTINVDEDTSFKKQNESITLADLKAGDRVFGRGAMKNDVFVPSVLNVGDPGMRRGGNWQQRGPQ